MAFGKISRKHLARSEPPIRKGKKKSIKTDTLTKYQGAGTIDKPVNNSSPPYKFVQLKYNQTITGAFSAGVPYVSQFRTNSMYDLDYTFTGHQPYGYDAYALEYEFSITYKTDYVITVQSAVDCQIVVRDAGNHATVPTNTSLEMERPRAISRMFTVGSKSPVIKYSVTCHKAIGLTMAQYMGHLSGFTEAMGTGLPVTPTFLNLMILATDAASTSAVSFKIDCISHSKLIFQKLRAQS
jgi:hypothetical protein